MDNSTKGLAVVTLGLAVVVYLRSGVGGLWEGFQLGMGTLLEVIPLLIAAFAVAGLIQVLIDEEQVTAWFGEEGGWKGIGIGALAGSIMPGGPYVYYPVLASCIKTGVDIPTLIAFVGAKSVWSLTRLPMEFALLGPKITILRFVGTFIAPPVMGFLALMFFPGLANSLRENLFAREREGDK